MTLLELLDLMKKRIKLVIALPLIFAIGVGVFSYVGLSDTYTATVSMYVLVKQEETTTSLQSDLSASQMVTNDVATLLESDRVVNGAASALGLKDLDAFKISITNSTSSRVITLDVTGTDPQQSADVANEMATKVSEVAREVMNVESINVVDSATAPENPSGPKRLLYIAVGFIAGLFLAVALVVIGDMLNTKVRGQSDLEKLLGVPVIGRVPAVKGGR
jgi:capsular polysaccharide biosynthesis protein